MARANIMGWGMLVVVVMALYVGKAEELFYIENCVSESKTTPALKAWYEEIFHYSSIRNISEGKSSIFSYLH
ncbi:hypothetical protein MKX01_005356 [Papaver californicum]|nr:hypothetical protein MKX01_005356 [Papaver californicum]